MEVFSLGYDVMLDIGFIISNYEIEKKFEIIVFSYWIVDRVEFERIY